MKEKNVPLTIRLPESRVKTIQEMAIAFGCSASRLASLMLEAGFVLVDEAEKKQRMKDAKAKRKVSENG